MLSDLACLRRKFEISNLKCIVILLLLMNAIFRSAYLKISCPKGCCVDLALNYFVVFIYLNLPRLVVDRFEIFAGVFLII